MAVDNEVVSLLRIPFFAGLKPPQIVEVARRAEHHEFRRGEVITRAGTSGDGAFLVLSGDAERKPARGSRAAPGLLQPGSLVGELAMLVEHVYGATVVAHGRVHCLKLTRAALHAQMREDPDLAQRLAGVIRDRLRRVAHELRCINRLLAECERSVHVGIPPPPMVPDMRRWAGK